MSFATRPITQNSYVLSARRLLVTNIKHNSQRMTIRLVQKFAQYMTVWTSIEFFRHSGLKAALLGANPFTVSGTT